MNTREAECPATASAPMPEIVLPPPPSLDDTHLRVENISTDAHGELEAFRPAGAPYLCTDEHAPQLLLVPGLGMDGLGFLRQLPLGACAHLHFFQMPNDPAAGETGLHQYARYVEDYILTRKLEHAQSPPFSSCQPNRAGLNCG